MSIDAQCAKVPIYFANVTRCCSATSGELHKTRLTGCQRTRLTGEDEQAGQPAVVPVRKRKGLEVTRHLIPRHSDVG